MKKEKRLFSILAAVVLMFVLSLTVFAAEYTLGDVNADGDITAADARLILRNSAELEAFSAEQETVADINADGDITAADARICLRISAELDDIKNYIIAVPDEEKVPVNEMSQYILSSLDEIIAAGKEVKYDEENFVWTADGYKFYANEYDYDFDGIVDDSQIYSVFIDGTSDYSIYGVKTGMTFDEALQALAANGYETAVDEYGDIYFSDYSTGIYFFATAYGGEKIEYVELFYSEIDLGYDIGSDIGYFMYQMPDVELLNEDENIYGNDIVDLYVSEYGYVNYLILKTEIDTVSIYGIRVGMTVEQVREALEWIDFVPRGDYLYNEYYDESLYIAYNEDGTVKRVELARGKYYNLYMYAYCGLPFVLNDFGSFAEDETGYSYENIHFCFDEYDYVSEVAINGESAFNIHGITYGSELNHAIESLANYGYEDVKVNAVNYYEGCYIEVLSDDGITVSGIRYGIVETE